MDSTLGGRRTTRARSSGRDGWSIVHASRTVFARLALLGMGSTEGPSRVSGGASGEPLVPQLPRAPDAAYIPSEMVDQALAFIHESMESGSSALVHCNQGMSRAPTIRLLYLSRVHGGASAGHQWGCRGSATQVPAIPTGWRSVGIRGRELGDVLGGGWLRWSIRARYSPVSARPS